MARRSGKTALTRVGTVYAYFKFFATLGDLFEARFLRPLWNKYPSRESDDWEAVGLFLQGYASERQGARPDFRHVAVDVIEELRCQGQLLTNKNTTQLAWDIFCRHLKGQGLNHANNPLCPQGISYERKTGPAITYNKSIMDFLYDISMTGLQPNIVSLAKTGLELDLVDGVHGKIQEINGIGPKIASLFLRDVALFYNLTPSKDRHLLQPVDTWIQRMFEQLTQQRSTSVQDTEKIQRWMLQESVRCDVRPEAVNEGTWYFSSQVADSEYRMSKALNDLGYAETLLNEYIEAVHQEVRAWGNLLCSKGGDLLATTAVSCAPGPAPRVGLWLLRSSPN